MSISVDSKLIVGMSMSPTWLHHQYRLSATDYNNTDVYYAKFYIDLAQRAEQVCLDFVFKPDSLFLKTVEDLENTGLSLKKLQGLRGTLDPNIIATTIAAHTHHIGIVTTLSTTFNQPYLVARQLMSMNWISQGRIGWNVVTSLDGEKNFGLQKMPDAKSRYAKAYEFVEVVQDLWQSFKFVDNDIDSIDITTYANANDMSVDKSHTQHQYVLLQSHKTQSHSFQNLQSVKKINHRGVYFKVTGPLNIPAYPNSRVAIFQAGASVIGRRFGAFVADAIFAATPNLSNAIELRNDLHRLAKLQHRQNMPKLLPGLYFFIRDNEDLAYQAYLQAHAHLTVAHRLQKIIDIIGVDLSHKAMTETVSISELGATNKTVRSQTHAQLLRDYIGQNNPTLQDLLNRPEVISSGHWTAVGTVEQVATMIISWTNNKAIDGFIALPGDAESLYIFFNKLMPYLIDNGYCRSSYNNQSFIQRLM